MPSFSTVDCPAQPGLCKLATAAAYTHLPSSDQGLPQASLDVCKCLILTTLLHECPSRSSTALATRAMITMDDECLVRWNACRSGMYLRLGQRASHCYGQFVYKYVEHAQLYPSNSLTHSLTQHASPLHSPDSRHEPRFSERITLPPGGSLRRWHSRHRCRHGQSLRRSSQGRCTHHHHRP